jgi:glycyl-tRNA synthetase beta chain
MMNDLLFELGTEELPSGAVLSLANQLAELIAQGLQKVSVQYGEVKKFGTPRRLAVLIKDVEDEQPSQVISRRGPACANSIDAEGHPLPALTGFAKSCGVSIDALSKTLTDKGEWWVYEAVQPGLKTTALLPALINEAIAKLAIAKPMRWGSCDELFARPVHWAVLMLGEVVVPCKIMGVETSAQTYGHRFHHNLAICIPEPQAYQHLLREAFVIADFEERQNTIVTQVKALAEQHQAMALMPASLIEEVTSIVEWPQALWVDFDKQFLEVPAEALVAAMQSHQKCFALQDCKGQLLPHFITVANIESRDRRAVVLGNEKVMRARLSDADFFFRQDKRQTLEDYKTHTANVVYQEKLGSLADKTKRLECLVEDLVQPLGLDRAQALRAASLSKCDLMTGMVQEFPELQGVMGYYYAQNDAEADIVATALHEQYMPRFAKDCLPSSPLGCALSLVDRLDTLVGAFALGQKPSGVKDPFKLRRHALAVVRLLVSIKAPLNLSTLLKLSLETFGGLLPEAPSGFADLKPFILERMQSFYQAQGIAPELLQAVLVRQDDWFYDTNMRIQALLAFTKRPEAISLSQACKRVDKLLNQTASLNHGQVVQIALLAEGQEKGLYERILKVEELVSPFYSTGDYIAVLQQLASLREPVDAFFEHVMVMVADESLKSNRLSLLSRLQVLLQGVADISLLQRV